MGLGVSFFGLAVSLVVVTSGCFGVSVTTQDWDWGLGGALSTCPPRTTWLHPGPGRGSRAACCGALLAWLGYLPFKSRLLFFPLHTSPVVRRVVIPAPITMRLSSRGRAFTGDEGFTTRSAPGCVSTVTLRVARTPAAPALQWVFWRNVRLHRHSQIAEIGERSYPRNFRSPSYGYFEMREWRAILGGVLVAAAGAELHDTLDTNVEGFQLL